MPKQGQAVWLGRTKDSESFYELGTNKKYWHSYLGFKRVGGSVGYITCFCPERFERITGFKLKPGEVRRIRIRIEET